MEHNIPELVAQLTLEEKAGLCSGADFWHTKTVERLGIPTLMVSDGPHGLRTQDPERDDPNHSRKAVCFPAGCSVAASFDPDLARREGAAIGREARAFGAGRRAGHRVHQRRTEPGGWYLHQAFCRQQPGVPSHERIVRHDGAYAARNLPACI